MFQIYEHKSIARKCSKLLQEVLKRYEKCKDIAALSGTEELRFIKGFHDEALKGKWNGYRSSKLNIQYRVIYKVENKIFTIYVVDLTSHDYRRR